jgi:HEAT repeat protein
MDTMHKRVILLGLIFLSTNIARGVDEKALIATLQTSTRAPEIWTACQQLRLRGTPQAVPALAALLDKPRLGHAALHALERMPFPEAGAVLRKALSQTSGPNKAGIIDALGWRRDQAAVPLLVPLLSDADTTIAASAAGALGRIGSKTATAALCSQISQIQPDVRQAIWEGMLLGAERQLATNDTAEAQALYRELLQAKTSPAIRMAAWRGWTLSDPQERSERIIKALKGTDTELQATALTLIREIKDKQVLAACHRHWDALPATAQLAVLDMHRPSSTQGRASLELASRSPHVTVRMAAWQASAEAGHPFIIDTLVHAAAYGETEERPIAFTSLVRISGPGIAQKFLGLLYSVPAPQQAVLVRLMGERGDATSAPLVLHFVNATESKVRIAALEALTALAAPNTLNPLLDHMVTAPDADRPALRKALRAVCQASPDKAQTGKQVIETFNHLSPEQRRTLLPVLADVATADAFQTVQTSALHDNLQLAREAVRVLGQWPNAVPMATLLDLARDNADPTLRILALRGAIGLVKLESDATRQRVSLHRALTLAQRADEKRQALSGLGMLGQVQALELILPYLDDETVVNEAALAALTIAESQAATYPKLIQDVSRRILERCQAPAIVKRAWNHRVTPGPGPFIGDWLVSEPYHQAGVSSALTVFQLKFGPEIPGTPVKWYTVPAGDTIPLAAFFPGQEHCLAYLKTNVVVPEAQNAMLLMGSDDGIQAWINGAVVHSNNIDRGQIVDQDRAPIQLKKGHNELLLKVSQGAGGWSACARIVGLDGHPIPELRVESQAKAAPPVGEYQKKPAAQTKPQNAVLPALDSYRTLCLSDKFYAEGAYYGDFNRDGTLDVVAGPFWFAGPDFETRHEFRPAKAFDPKGYSDNFLTFTGDFNSDSWIDIFCVPWPGKEGYWYANPAGKSGHWQQHLAHANIGNESPVWGDVTGDGRPELLFCIDGHLGYAGPNPKHPGKPWAFHAVSTKNKRYQQYTHGVGFGDINSDGRTDIVEAIGWWEQPAQRVTGQPWAFHAFHFADAACQMLVYDVDGDGQNDIITAWHCHHYGLIWWKQVTGANGDMDWQQHVILTPTPDISSSEFRPSQLHALELVDMNGDGLLDILTGKRFWAHGPSGDKEPDAPAVIFWLELKRTPNRKITFIPHMIDDNSGVGTQVATARLNDDSRPDVIVGNKKGIFIHLSK